MRRREGAIPAPEVKLNQSMATLVVPNPPGTFPISEVDTPTRPLLSLPGSRRLRNPGLKSVVKKVRLDKAKPANFEDLGPAARSRYDTTGGIGCDGTNPDPVPNPPVTPKMITATASHVLAIPTKVRAIPIEGRANMTGILARAPTKSQLGRKTRAWLPS